MSALLTLLVSLATNLGLVGRNLIMLKVGRALCPIFCERARAFVGREREALIIYDFSMGLFNFAHETPGLSRKAIHDRTSLISQIMVFWFGVRSGELTVTERGVTIPLVYIRKFASRTWK